MSDLQCGNSRPQSLPGIKLSFKVGQTTVEDDCKFLIFGQMDDTVGTALPDTEVEVFNNEDTLFGVGTQAALMVKALRSGSPNARICVVPQAPLGVCDEWTVEFAGVPVATPTVIDLVVADTVYSCPVDSTNGVFSVPNLFADKINADTDAGISATAAGGVLTLKAISPGCSTAFTVSDTYLRGDITPGDVALTITNTVPGDGDPPITAALDEASENCYCDAIMPYCELLIVQEFCDWLCEQWDICTDCYTRGHTLFDGTAADRADRAATLNDPHKAMYGPWCLPAVGSTALALIAGISGTELTNAPSEPLAGTAIPGLVAPDLDKSEPGAVRDSLLTQGVTTFQVDDDGTVRFDRLITTYSTDQFGARDTRFQCMTTLAQLRVIGRALRQRISREYVGYSYRGDDYDPQPGQKVVTLTQIQGFVQNIGDELSDQNIIQNPEQWAESVNITVNADCCIAISVDPELVPKLICWDICVNAILKAAA